MGGSPKFQLNAGHFALDFANTLDNRYSEAGPTELLTSFERLVSLCREGKLIPAGEARRLLRQTGGREAARALHAAVELREAVYALFRNAARDQAPPRTELETLNRFLADGSASAAVDWRQGKYVWRRTDPAENPRALLTGISHAAAELLTVGDLGKLRECGEHTCLWLFLDHSKNHSRRWCDMKICGNRTKARKFQDRRKSDACPR